MKKELEFRPASLEERREFYENEFNLKEVKEWFKKNEIKLPQLCAVDAGTETGIIVNKKLREKMLYFPFKNLMRKIKEYIPEDVYYSRNFYSNPDKVLRTLRFLKWKKQELVFDIDSDNIVCVCKKGAKVCDFCVNETFIWAKKMKKELEMKFKKVIMVYSGRGFHLHILDGGAFSLTFNERKRLTRKFSKYPIDPWVSRGYIDLIRMPYSLNGLVSRKVIPLNRNSKFEKIKSHPRFLQRN